MSANDELQAHTCEKVMEEYIKELKEEIAYEKEMIAKGDHVEERKRDIKDMEAELRNLVSGKKRG